MKVIIVGCGRMGFELLKSLNNQGHHVVIIDENAKVFEGLPSFRNVTYRVGVGFDKEVLESANIENSDAVIACTNNDEVNALVARIAKIYYRVPQVIARQYKTENASVYEMLGIRAISTTEWGIKKTLKILDYTDLESVATFGNSDVEVVKVNITPLLVGKSVSIINSMGAQVVSILRNNKAFIPLSGTEFENGDLIYVAVAVNDIQKFSQNIGL